MFRVSLPRQPVRQILENRGVRGWYIFDTSASSRRLVFSHGPNLFVATLAGKRIRKVVNREVLDARLSPNGQAVAFVAADPAGTSAPCAASQIWTVNSDGSTLRKVSDCAAHPAWGASGGRIAFIGRLSADWRSGEVTSAAADGSGRRELAAWTSIFAPEITWSSRGGWLAYVDGMRSQIVRVARFGRGPRTLGPGSSPTWSPNGSHVAFVRREHGHARWSLSVIQRDGRNLRRLDRLGQPGSPEWAPRGSRIAYVGYVLTRCQCNSQVFLVSPESGRRIQVTHESPGTIFGRLFWTSEAKTIVFEAMPPNGH
ncbi:MAG: hypothetical protein M3R70_05595 [Actinomycetota bacterium]|nr:hypothetical protein [Actinomycetota bacterium]